MTNRTNLDWSRIHRKPAAVWSCDKCHWQNPAVCKNCGNCGKPRKEAP